MVSSSTAGGWTPDWNAPWSAATLNSWDPATTPLTEDLAVTLALRDSPAIRADLERIAAARADLVQSRLLPNPMLSLAFGIPFAGTDGGTQVSISAMQGLTSLWRRPHAGAAADAALRETVLTVSDRALDLAARTRVAHARALSAARALELQRELAATVERQLSITRASAGAGELPMGAVDAAEIAVGEARRAMLARGLALETAKRELLELMGRASDDAGFTLALGEGAGAVRAEIDERGAIEMASAQRLDVAAALAARDGASAGLRLAGLAPLPELSAGAMYEREMDGAEMLGPAVSVEIPIFDDGSAGRALAAAEARRADLLARSVLSRAVHGARAAQLAHASAVAVVGVYHAEVLPASERAVGRARSLYGSGEATMIELLAAERELAGHRLGAVEAELEAQLALIALERAVGGRVVETGVRTRF